MTDMPVAPTVPWWHLHRRLYDWTLGWAHRPSSSLALFGLSQWATKQNPGKRQVQQSCIHQFVSKKFLDVPGSGAAVREGFV